MNKKMALIITFIFIACAMLIYVPYLYSSLEKQPEKVSSKKEYPKSFIHTKNQNSEKILEAKLDRLSMKIEVLEMVYLIRLSKDDHILKRLGLLKNILNAYEEKFKLQKTMKYAAFQEKGKDGNQYQEVEKLPSTNGMMLEIKELYGRLASIQERESYMKRLKDFYELYASFKHEYPQISDSPIPLPEEIEPIWDAETEQLLVNTYYGKNFESIDPQAQPESLRPYFTEEGWREFVELSHIAVIGRDETSYIHKALESSRKQAKKMEDSDLPQPVPTN